MDDKTLKNFWAKVNKNGTIPPHAPDLGPCWVWEGNLNWAGYGMFAGKKGGKKRKAHRIAWELENGTHDLCVLHKCDNPACIRVSHLFLGTQRDNCADMRAKNRGVNPPLHVGQDNNLAKLDPESVTEIRNLYAQGVTQAKIGARFGVGQATISSIVLGKTWQHISGSVAIARPPNLSSRSGTSNYNAKMNPEKVLLLRQLHGEGATYAELSRKFGINPTTAKSIATHRTWRSVAA